MKLKTIEKIINQHGGLSKLGGAATTENLDYIKIENKPYMPLVIEMINNKSHYDLPEISVLHHYTQNGDYMRDPEMCFLVKSLPDGSLEFYPSMYQQDSLGIYQIVFPGDSKANIPLQRNLMQFAAIWDRNLHQQGFDRIKQLVTA